MKTMEDRALARHLRAKIEKGLKGVGVKGLQFYVRDGTVAVYGMVQDAGHRDLILSLMHQVPGVRSIDLQVQVLDPSALLQPRNRRHAHGQRA